MRIDLAEVEVTTEESPPVTAVTTAAAVDGSSMDSTDDYDGVEAELTSLSWLQSLDITSASGLPTPPCSPSPPPVARQPPKKLSPLAKAELGNHCTFQGFNSEWGNRVRLTLLLFLYENHEKLLENLSFQKMLFVFVCV